MKLSPSPSKSNVAVVFLHKVVLSHEIVIFRSPQKHNQIIDMAGDVEKKNGASRPSRYQSRDLDSRMGVLSTRRRLHKIQGDMQRHHKRMSHCCSIESSIAYIFVQEADGRVSSSGKLKHSKDWQYNLEGSLVDGSSLRYSISAIRELASSTAHSATSPELSLVQAL